MRRSRLEAAEDEILRLAGLLRQQLEREDHAVDVMAATAAQDQFGYAAKCEELRGELVGVYRRLQIAKGMLTREARNRYERENAPEVVEFKEDGTRVGLLKNDSRFQH